jgi:arsenical pump membrane protein
MLFNSAIWIIAAAATLGVIARPWDLPEFIWAIAGAAMLTLFHLLPWREAAAAVGEATDVYLFLIGMMLLSEIARKQGLFD